MQQHIRQVDIGEFAAGEDPLRSPRQTLVHTRVTGVLILRVSIAGHAVIPAAGPRDAISLTIEAVSLFTVHTFHQRAGIGILGITCIQVALAAVAGFKLQRLHRRKFPAQLTVDIFIHYAFASSRIRSRIATGSRRFVTGINILGISLRFAQISP